MKQNKISFQYVQQKQKYAPRDSSTNSRIANSQCTEQMQFIKHTKQRSFSDGNIINKKQQQQKLQTQVLKQSLQPKLKPVISHQDMMKYSVQIDNNGEYLGKNSEQFQQKNKFNIFSDNTCQQDQLSLDKQNGLYKKKQSKIMDWIDQFEYLYQNQFQENFQKQEFQQYEKQISGKIENLGEMKCSQKLSVPCVWGKYNLKKENEGNEEVICEFQSPVQNSQLNSQFIKQEKQEQKIIQLKLLEELNQNGQHFQVKTQEPNVILMENLANNQDDQYGNGNNISISNFEESCQENQEVQKINNQCLNLNSEINGKKIQNKNDYEYEYDDEAKKLELKQIQQEKDKNQQINQENFQYYTFSQIEIDKENVNLDKSLDSYDTEINSLYKKSIYDLESDCKFEGEIQEKELNSLQKENYNQEKNFQEKLANQKEEAHQFSFQSFQVDQFDNDKSETYFLQQSQCQQRQNEIVNLINNNSDLCTQKNHDNLNFIKNKTIQERRQQSTYKGNNQSLNDQDCIFCNIYSQIEKN